MLNHRGIAELSSRFASGQPFPHIVIEDFVDRSAALDIARAYPSWEDASRLGYAFKKLNENLKVQITEYAKFPSPVQRLADALASQEFRDALSAMTGIPNLLWDDGFAGGGMHQTASSGLLDVHVDFNLLEEKGWYRRLNLLLYLNPTWRAEWGGSLELWDREVAHCHHTIVPSLARCVIFETSDRSFHGVTAVKCPSSEQRISFAAYYYTKEAPAGWEGRKHSTVFKARPDEYLKKHLLMPAAKVEEQVKQGVHAAKQRIKRVIGL